MIFHFVQVWPFGYYWNRIFAVHTIFCHPRSHIQSFTGWASLLRTGNQSLMQHNLKVVSCWTWTSGSELSMSPDTQLARDLSLYHNCDSTMIWLRYDHIMTHLTTMKVIEIMVCIQFNCDTTMIRLQWKMKNWHVHFLLASNESRHTWYVVVGS